MYNYSPYHTLAAEEFMLKNIKENEVILFLYTHPKAVIIGRNQNAWTECRVDKLEKDGGKIARRISGGGAVYHDLGNLNFSFILNKEIYDLARQQNVLSCAVKSIGINSRVSGRNDILADGKKFSGNAFCFKKNSAFHHGTILVNTDLSNLAKYLNVSPQKIQSKGISSVKSRVINLTELKPEITVEQIAEALISAFQSEYGNSLEYKIEEKYLSEIGKLRERNASWDWKFGQSPKFNLSLERKFSWGLIEVKLFLKDGRIENCAIYSDAMDADFIADVTKALQGAAYSINDIKKSLTTVPYKEQTAETAADLINLFAEQNL